MRVQEGKGLDIKPPDLGVGVCLPLVVHRDRASHVIHWVGAAVQEESCSVTCAQNLNLSSQVATVIASTLPVVEKRPHGASRQRVGKAIPDAQGKCRVWGRLGDGNLHICSFTQGQGQGKLVLRKEGFERCI